MKIKTDKNFFIGENYLILKLWIFCVFSTSWHAQYVNVFSCLNQTKFSCFRAVEKFFYFFWYWLWSKSLKNDFFIKFGYCNIFRLNVMNNNHQWKFSLVKSDKMAKSQKLPQMKINTDENQNQQNFYW